MSASHGVVRGELILDRTTSGESHQGTELAGLLPRFFLSKTTIRARHTRERYVRAVRWFGELLGRPATTADLTDEHIGAVAQWLIATRDQQPRTANSTLESLAALWKWASSKKLAEGWPTIQPFKEPRREPKAFSKAELGRLVDAARNARGSINGMPASVFWTMVLQVTLNTGARTSELLALRWEWLDWDSGWIRVPAEFRKGGRKDMVYALWAETVAFLAKYRKPSGLIFGCEGRPDGWFFYEWNKLLDGAGLPNNRHVKTQCLRRTFATVVDLSCGNASQALGHENPELAARHYLDKTFKPVGRHADVIPEDWRPLSLVTVDTNERPTADKGRRHA